MQTKTFYWHSNVKKAKIPIELDEMNRYALFSDEIEEGTTAL